MKKVTVSAPGKLMIMGEHAVVYGHPCIVTAVGQRMQTTIEKIESNELQINAPDVEINNYKKSLTEIGTKEIPKGAIFIEKAVSIFYKTYNIQTGIKVTTTSEFSSLFGFGSSSASTVCVVKALSELFEKNLSNKELFDLSYKVVLEVQTKGSGFDIAAAVYGGTLYFVTGGKTIEQLSVPSIPLVVAYSGIKADTVSLVNHVAELKSNNPELVHGIFSKIDGIVEQAKKSLLQQDWKTLGQLMDINQLYLDQLEVTTDILSQLIHAAKKAGALGAKLSGAGGGDCIIALSPSQQKDTQDSLEQAGGHIIQVETNVEGVRIETHI